MKTSGLKFNVGLRNVSNILSLLGFFFLTSMPSLKLLYSSEVLNLLPVVFFVGGFLLCPRLENDSKKAFVLVLWFLFSIFLVATDFVFGIDGYAGVFRRLYFLLVVALAIVFANKDIAARLPVLLMMWGWFLSVWQIALGVVYVRSLGQTYLTVAMPIGVSLCISILYLLKGDTRVLFRLCCLAGALACLVAISTLRVRGVLIYSGFAIFLFSIFGLISSKELRVQSKIASVLGFLFLLSLLVVYFIPRLEFTQIYRFERLLENPEEESRVGIYMRSLEYIADNPIFGVGAGAIEKEIGIYPHNIMLEVLLSVGAVGAIPFFVLIFFWARRLVFLLRYSESMKSLTGVAAASLIFFLQWNTSFDLATAYIPLSAIVLFMCGQSGSLVREVRSA